MNTLFATLFTLAHTASDRLKREDRGATAVEYGLLVGLIAVVIIVGVTAFGSQLSGLFSDVSGTVNGVTPAAP